MINVYLLSSLMLSLLHISKGVDLNVLFCPVDKFSSVWRDSVLHVSDS